jgi:hypothetical protein
VGRIGAPGEGRIFVSAVSPGAGTGAPILA